MPWVAILSNNEIVKQVESDPSSWRQLHDRCLKENLKIKDIKFDGEDPHDPREMDAYFVLYDILVLNVLEGGTDQHVKIGVGAFYKNSKKARIKWYKVDGNPILYTEIIQDGSVYREITINKVADV